jgi:hypothetical protein
MLSPAFAAALAFALVAGCGGDGDSGGPDGGSSVDCQADLTLALPDGTSTVNDYCQFRQIQAEFEFDFDTPPEVRNARLRLYAATTADVDCYVEITLPEACAPGVYPIDGSGNAVQMVTLDCSGVSDAFEGTFVASSGYVRVDEFNAGSTPGFFTGMPLVTRFNGFVSVTSPEGVRLEGAFIAQEELLGVDAEGAVCETPLPTACATCPPGTTCNASGMCTTSCTPSCSGRMCGSDGCGGTCGTCGSGSTCNVSGVCESSSAPAIGSACTMDSQCGAGRVCLPETGGWPGGYCSLDCTSATCPTGSTCITGVVAIDVCLADCPPACRAGYTCTPAGPANVCI